MLQLLMQRSDLTDHPSLVVPLLGILLVVFAFALVMRH